MGNETGARFERAQAVGVASAVLAAAGVLILGSTAELLLEPISVEPDVLVASVPGPVDRTTITAVVTARNGPLFAETRALEGSVAPALGGVEAPEPTGTNELPLEEPSEEILQIAEPEIEESRRPTESAEGTPPARRDAQGPARGAGLRDRASAANVRAREIARDVSRSSLATAVGRSDAFIAGSTAGPKGFDGTWALGSPLPLNEVADLADIPSTSRFVARHGGDVNDAPVVPRKIVAVDESSDVDTGEPVPQTSSSELSEESVRHLLFVWDTAIILDEARSAELLAFATQRGFSTLAVEATGVGYHDAVLTAAMGRFTEDARASGLETFALIGYPWFTVAPHAGLPGQPTSSLEGIAILETIVETGLFDGVVDDSHSYGVEYEVNGETRNWLFDEPAAAGVDLQAWLRSAKATVGDLPLVKTTPFWFDSHSGLQDIVDLDGQGFLSLAHLVASEVDATAVLAYRDEFSGPNGILELVSGELTMGPVIITLETGDQGTDLDYLTFHEEGLRPLNEMIADLGEKLGTFWGFSGTGVHHYEPLKVLADDLLSVESFGFVGLDSVTVQNKVLVDAYDSSLGRYYDQMSYKEAIGAIAGTGHGALVSNGDIALSSGALVFGDARAGLNASVSQSHGAVVTGEALSLASPLTIPSVASATLQNAGKLDVKWNRTGRIVGDGHYKRIRLDGYASLTIEGPADIVVDELRLGNQAWIYVDPTNGPVSITVNKRIDLADYSWIAPTTLQARDLTIRYAGDRRVHMKYASRLLGDVLAPHADIRMDNTAEIYGRARAKRLDLQYGSELHLDVDLLRILPQ